jgi:hypothetical protein
MPSLPHTDERLADDEITFACELIGRRDIVGSLEIARINLRGVDEFRKVERLLGLEPRKT